MGVSYSGDIGGVRFGYLDRDSNFSLIYERGESDKSVFPGQTYE